MRCSLESSTSANTRRAYNQAWRRFAAWTGARSVPALPATPELAAAFLAELVEEGLSVATLRLQKSALAKVHRSAGHQDPTENEGVRQVMAGIARDNARSQRQAKPLTAEALAAVRATAKTPRQHQGRARREESARDAERRGRVDIAMLSVLRDGLLRRSEAAALRWGDVEFQEEDGAALLHVRRSKTDPEGEGVVLYIGQAAAQALQAIMPEDAAEVDPAAPVFGLSASQIGRRVKAEAARYTERQTAGRGAVARYYQGRGS